METSSNSPKTRVGILFGGKSAEHEVSVQSAKSVVASLDTTRFEPILIGIDTKGGWRQLPDVDAIRRIETLSAGSRPINPAQTLAAITNDVGHLDILFPVLHGQFGEDGTVQGLLELTGIPYVGCGVLSSAVGMDKDVTKRLLCDAGVPIADFATLTLAEQDQVDAALMIEQFGPPLFVKPANTGSSVGVSKVVDETELLQAIKVAFQYDTKILIEKAVRGDEIECAVLGNDHPRASVIGRIIPKADFYTYEAKYHDADDTVLEIPADLPSEVVGKAQKIAIKTFKVLGCSGMARVDMFVTQDGEILVNEINTIPGFTNFSMYPQLWEASGVPYSELLAQLINLGVERFTQRQRLRTSYERKIDA